MTTTQELLTKLHEKGMADTYAETSRYFTGTPEDVGESVFESHEMHVESIQLSAAIAMGKLCAEQVKFQGVGIEEVKSLNGDYQAFKYRGNMEHFILSLVAELEGKK